MGTVCGEPLKPLSGVNRAGSFGGSGAASLTPGTYSGKGFGTYGAPRRREVEARLAAA